VLTSNEQKQQQQQQQQQQSELTVEFLIHATT